MIFPHSFKLSLNPNSVSHVRQAANQATHRVAEQHEMAWFEEPPGHGSRHFY